MFWRHVLPTDDDVILGGHIFSLLPRVSIAAFLQVGVRDLRPPLDNGQFLLAS